ncbi:adenylyltransferase/cytidyltransferase family protein [Arsenophonus nasoniae]|uniref:ethanolamine-phosphate cytidylyltransferase n=1 Tax=Arsenophonus nasoniae TaxID=638 RepID=A0A4P7KUN4_9GAMM|nr:adenylyltransferase/cytidyltransferase family protein [Arsenophonus nasoniae]QBY42210.1 Glycerol-3-phosphate cytidylyltransferase [Arsenophonus nasoniae]WGM06366.1 adenylyltransferase/cytidyltransferase family protein [Arsenophonus nasoniae]WGM11300.1 adenylyltransferase/cytidyltransferase family protein [Arsenophonus nasoniae]WGM16000.1 adenylyltransferase/cytidyltransferase family protein [Arsenophonus nasoniae]
MKNVIYTSGVFDLLHASHVRALKSAKAQGGKDAILIVGVATDEDTQSYKRKPVIPYEQRIKMIKSLDFVDEVITAPLFTNKQFYDFFGITLHVQGDDDAGAIDYYKGGKDLSIIRFIGRDPIESTTSCISKLKDIVGEDFIVEPLYGGISNMAWKISSKMLAKKCVLKYLQSSTAESFSLRHDCIILGGTFALYQYIDGIVGHVNSKEIVEYFIQKKRDTKNFITGLQAKNEIKAFCPALMKYIDKKNIVLLETLKFFDIIYEDIRSWCWTHNDLVRENIIKTSKNEIIFIDWEYADMAPFEMDIASCVINDVIDFSDLDQNEFDIKFVSLLIIFQCIVWINWYKHYPEKYEENLVKMYIEKMNFYKKKLREIK